MEVDEFLEHFGVKGMQWGVRNNNSGIPHKTNKAAQKDAEEFARAKMFFGNGAGTRRKLINASVTAKKAKDPLYAKAFDSHLAKQDMSTHAQKARSERNSVDRKDKTKKRAGYVARRLTGEMGTQAAFTAAIIGGAAFINSARGRAMRKQAVSKVKNYQNTQKGKAAQKIVMDFFKKYN